MFLHSRFHNYSIFKASKFITFEKQTQKYTLQLKKCFLFYVISIEFLNASISFNHHFWSFKFAKNLIFVA